MTDSSLISRAFLYFERLGFKRPFEKTGDPKAQERYEALTENDWHELFQFVEPAIFEAACKLTAKRIKFWPKPADMMAAIDELTPKKDPYPVVRLPAPRSRAMSPAVKRALDLVHTQDFQAARDAAPPCPIATGYAAMAYPDMSPDLIKRSEIELRYLAREKERCGACDKRYKHTCPTNGYKAQSRMDKLSGYVVVVMAPCGVHGGYKAEEAKA